MNWHGQLFLHNFWQKTGDVSNDIFFFLKRNCSIVIFKSDSSEREVFSFQLTGTVGDDPNVIFKSHPSIENFERNLLQEQLNTWPRKLLAAASYATKNSDCYWHTIFAKAKDGSLPVVTRASQDYDVYICREMNEQQKIVCIS